MKKKKIISIIVFSIGFITLVCGVVFLIIKLVSGPRIQDGEYLVETGRFELENEPGVVWNFTEIGKGNLTTNDNLNTYDFIWTLEGDRIKIETDWLYTLNDEYKYRIDGGNLVLIDENSVEIKFVPRGGVDAEVSEDDELVVGD